MKNFLTNFPFREISIFVTIVGSFTYNVLLERDVACTCKDVTRDCTLYMLLPFFVILLLILWTDKTFERICKHTFICYYSNTHIQQAETSRQCYRKELCGVFITRFFKAVGVALLWVASVLIDGDWYVCCLNDHSEKQSQLSCKDKNNITAEETVIINTLKNTSKIWGFSLLLGIIFVAALMSLCDWRRCCPENSCCVSRREVYDTVLLEEGENVLKETLREAAKGQLLRDMFEKIQEIRGEDEDEGEGEMNWIECLDVASEMVVNQKEPKLSKKQKRKLQGQRQQQPQED